MNVHLPSPLSLPVWYLLLVLVDAAWDNLEIL